jgi:quinol monooxygenase YgiN
MFSFLLKKSLVKGAAPRVALAGVVLVLLAGLFVSCADPISKLTDNAQKPTITTQPQDGNWDVGEEDEFELTVTASVTDDGILSYQWYSNPTDGTPGSVKIDGGTSATLTLNSEDYTENGDYYFYVVVTNTNNQVTGTKTASTISAVATITVDGIGGVYLNAKKPVINAQPADTFWNVFTAEDGVKFTVEAEVDDGGALSYQWYSGETAGDTVNGDEISEATSNEFTLTKTTCTANGAYYFYVIVTNTNDEVSGTKTVSAASDAVTVTVVGYPDTGYSDTHTIPDNLIGEWESEYGELYTISASEFSSGMEWEGEWSGYKGTIVNHRGNAAGTAGYITIQYTECTWDDNAEDLYYVIYYKDLTATTVTIAGAGSFVFTDPDFGASGGRATKEKAEATYTVSAGYFEMGSDLEKAGSEGVNAEQPTITAITGSPTAGTWNVSSANTFDLTVTASVTDGGTLSYQWYSNSTNSNSGGTAINTEGTSATLSLAKANYTENKNYYFYVVVTNTNNNASGTKTATTTSNATTVTVSGNSGSSVEVVIPAGLGGYFQTPMIYYDGYGHFDDAFAVDATTKTFHYYFDSTMENYWGGTIVSISEDNSGDGGEPAILIVQITGSHSDSAWATLPETGKYFAYAYKSLAGDIVSSAAPYGDEMQGVDTIEEAIIEYTAENSYFATFGTYTRRTITAANLASLQGTWHGDEDKSLEDYTVIIQGTAYFEFLDDYEDSNFVYDGSTSEDMLTAIGEIVDYTDFGTSGIMYIKTVVAEYPYSNEKYIAVAWQNKSGNSIEFATGSNEKDTLALIKTEYANIAAFGSGFFDYTK